MHEDLPPADKLPWTISYVIKKRRQIDSFNELPKEKRPPDYMIWYGTGEELDDWFDKVFKKSHTGRPDEFVLNINDDDIG